MKKIVGTFMLIACTGILSAQYMIVGKDSISVDQFKKEYKYGLENSGIESTIKTTQNFLLFQQFAADKKADTLVSFREKMGRKLGELRSKYFFPASVVDPVLKEYVDDNQTEREIQVFIIEKRADDSINYLQLYNDVKSGKISMEEAIAKYSKLDPKPVYQKPGSVDYDMYTELKTLPNNSYTKFYDTPSYYGFAKVLNTRPTLGYIIFGTISFPKDEKAAALQQNIYKELKAGKKFEEVAKLYGTSENEKNNAGIVMGSPTLPNEVYALFKNKKVGYYTPEPLLYNDQYFIFSIFNIEPYVLNEKTKSFFRQELSNSLYADVLEDRMVAYLKADPTYKEFPAYQQVKKSFAAFSAAKDTDLLLQFKNEKATVADLKKMMGDKIAQASKFSPVVWTQAIDNLNRMILMRIYSKYFTQMPQVRQELNDYRKGLYADFIYSKYLVDELNSHPEWLTAYYNKNKSKYVVGERADGRVAVFSDPKLVKDITKQIKDPKNWENLKTKYSVRKEAQKEAAVTFETGEMSREADVFTQYNVPFQQGVHQTVIGAKTLVIAIDKILPPMQMTQQQATEELKDAVTEQKLNEIIAAQKAKTTITVQPEFLKDLEKNFKK